LDSNNIKEVGDVLWKMANIGSKLNEISQYGPQLPKLMHHLKEKEGCELVGMSSIGPSVIIVTKKSLQEIQSITSSFEFVISYETEVDNEGLVTQVVNYPELIFVLGGAGAGKSTLSKSISEKYGFHHMSVGQLLRDKQKEDPNSETGKIIAEIFANGEVADRNDITTNLVIETIQKLKVKGIVLDGFPRTAEQGILFADKGFHCSTLLFLSCDISVRANRLLIRSQTSNRTDDNQDAIQKRLSKEMSSLQKIVDVYHTNHIFHEIPSDKSEKEIFEAASKIMQERP